MLIFQVEEVRLNYRDSAATLPIDSQYAQPRPIGVSTDKEDFTSESGGPASSGEKNEAEDEE